MERTKGTRKAREAAEAIERLRETLKPGDTVYTTLRHVSSSGMSRNIGVHAIKDNEPLWLSRLVATATGFRWNDKKEALSVQGCGMDMGFHVVYELSYKLFPGGFGCIGEGPDHRNRCPSNDHSNGDRDYTPHAGVMVPCAKCQDVPGKDGLGRPCKGCDGSGEVEAKHDREHWHKDGGYALRHRWL